MKPRDRGHGKISEHFAGVGTVTRDMVVERARELAQINGRDPRHYTKDDFLAAKQELTGVTPAANEREDETLAGSLTWGEDPGSTGHSVEKLEAPDEQVETERMVEEGVEEAEHEQMVEGAKLPPE